MELEVIFGVNVSDEITVTATVGEGSVSGAYVKLFLDKESDPHSNARTKVGPFPVGVQTERFFELPTGSNPRVEVDLTAGSAGLPVSVSVGDGTKSASASGFSSETLSLELV